MMERRDQKKFEMFLEPLIQYDGIWEEYAQRYGYKLELNQYRKPGRILRSGVNSANQNTSYVIDFYLEPIWHHIDYEDNLPYTLAVCAFYDDPGNPEVRWRLAKKIIHSVPLNQIGSSLKDYLDQAFSTITEWTPDL